MLAFPLVITIFLCYFQRIIKKRLPLTGSLIVCIKSFT